MFYSLVRLFNIAFSTLNSHKILPNLSLKSDINDMLFTLRLSFCPRPSAYWFCENVLNDLIHGEYTLRALCTTCIMRNYVVYCITKKPVLITSRYTGNGRLKSSMKALRISQQR